MLRTQQNLSSAEEELEKFTKNVAELSWGLLTTVPPLISSQPSRYARSRHIKENWDAAQSDDGMTYLRPVLYYSYEGRVAEKGWVTNQPTDPDNIESSEMGPGPYSDITSLVEDCAIKDDDFVIVASSQTPSQPNTPREPSTAQLPWQDLLTPAASDEREEGETEYHTQYEALSLFRK